MATFIIENERGIRIDTVHAQTVERAADIYAHRTNQRARAHRHRGDRGKNGVFQAYRRAARLGGETSCGEPFIVRVAA